MQINDDLTSVFSRTSLSFHSGGTESKFYVEQFIPAWRKLNSTCASSRIYSGDWVSLNSSADDQNHCQNSGI